MSRLQALRECLGLTFRKHSVQITMAVAVVNGVWIWYVENIGTQGLPVWLSAAMTIGLNLWGIYAAMRPQTTVATVDLNKYDIVPKVPADAAPASPKPE